MFALHDPECCRGLNDPSGERTDEPPASTKGHSLDVPHEHRANAASVIAVVMIFLESNPSAMVTHGIREQAGFCYAVLHRMRIGYVDASLDEEGWYPHETESKSRYLVVTVEGQGMGDGKVEIRISPTA